jgi:hypothetical protein
MKIENKLRQQLDGQPRIPLKSYSESGNAAHRAVSASANSTRWMAFRRQLISAYGFGPPQTG